MKTKVLLLLFLPLFLFAGKIVSFDIQTSTTRIPEGGIATLQATLVTNSKANFETPQFPESSDYKVVKSTSRQSSSNSIQIINGRRSAQRRIETTFYYNVIFSKDGKVTLPELTVVVEGEVGQTKPIVFTVGGDVKDESPVTVSFMRSKSQIFLNEQLPLKIRFLVRLGMNASLTNEGFQDVIQTVQEKLGDKLAITITSDNVEQSRKVINGISYEVVDLDLSLTAIDTGAISIAPIPFTYAERKELRSQSFFTQTQNVEASTRTPRLSLKVVPPPAAPAGYTGIVGKVRLRGSVSDKDVMVGDGITLKYVLSGRMKAADLGDVKVPKLPDFETFTPERRTIADSTNGRISTKKEISYMLIPREAGEFTIPATDVVWFDPSSGKYHRETAGPYKITVSPSDKPVETTKRYLTKEQIATVGSDIRYIKTTLPVEREILKPYQKSIFVILLPLPWLLLLVMVLYKLSVKLNPTNEEKSIRKGALGRAYKELDKISKGKSKGSPAGVVEQFLLQKYKISAPSMRRDELRVALADKGATESAVDAIVHFLDAVEMARYSGSESSDSLVKEAKTTLKSITREVN